ncbi:hypothetical protein U8464_RS23045 [Escherichia coli]
MQIASGLFSFMWPLIGLVIIGIGFWGLGQWLRKRGYGEKLDNIDHKVTKAQRTTAKALGPFSGFLVGMGRGLSNVPLIGSRRSRQMWRELEEFNKLKDKSQK